MSLAFTEGWDNYAAGAIPTPAKWQTVVSSVWSISTSAGVNGGPAAVAANVATSSNYLQNFSVRTNFTGQVLWGCWVKISAAPTATSFLIRLLDTANNLACGIEVSSLGKAIYVNNAGATQATGVTTITDNVYHWLEGSVPINAVSAPQLYIDNVLDITAGINQFSNAPIGNWQLANLPGAQVTFDDFILYFNTAPYPTAAAFPLNQQAIQTIWPTADSSVSFTQSSAAASNAALINSIGFSTATFVQSATVGNRDLYTYGSLGYSPVSINGVTINSFMENPSFGGILEDQIAMSNAVLGALSTSIVPGTPIVVQQMYTFDPNTSTQWKSSAVNAATYGIRVSTASS